ncbi:hypothetical protein CEUSTIGMA_g14093.t1 [Chlamydomonas eustigma]|uniref:Uncharacterized protein n=1 Tax=Chlamydomonas eustigma TaxID=1157962 RepID=A0A250XUH2_9CHLO|nr:hypothetical protein CEUSTIGMA_g14093.t1 [Chlamydomonas eustigma]|eukprot:GAX86686.1 hypothetical protein CEUSTIGMA_g14093.t1 [Chlamydomonas eustigma]
MLELILASALSVYAFYKIVKFAFADADSNLLSKGDHKSNAFQGKVVWCTGASQGLGLTLVKHFAEHGARIILSSRSAGRLEEVKASLPTHPNNVIVLPFDLCGSPDQLQKAAAAADAAFDDAGVDYLIQNAGNDDDAGVDYLIQNAGNDDDVGVDYLIQNAGNASAFIY